MRQILSIKLSLYWKMIIAWFYFLSIITQLAGHWFLPPSLISFLAALHPQRCCCHGWEDTWKEKLYRPSTEKHKTRRGGGECMYSSHDQQPRYFNQHSFTPLRVHLGPLYKLPPNRLCLLGKYWSRRDLPPDNYHTNQGLCGEGKEGWANTCVGNVIDEYRRWRHSLWNVCISKGHSVGNWKPRLTLCPC